MSKPKPKCVEVYGWLRENLGKNHGLGALTGCDSRALEAAVMILEAYSYDRDEVWLEGFAIAVRRMQPCCWEFAYHAIAMVMDWSDRTPVWFASGLEAFRVRRCEHEPRERAVEEVAS